MAGAPVRPASGCGAASPDSSRWRWRISLTASRISVTAGRPRRPIARGAETCAPISVMRRSISASRRAMALVVPGAGSGWLAGAASGSRAAR